MEEEKEQLQEGSLTENVNESIEQPLNEGVQNDQIDNDIDTDDVDIDESDYSFGLDSQGVQSVPKDSTSESDNYVKLSKSEYEALKSKAESAKYVYDNPVAQAIVNWVEQGNRVEDFVSKGLYTDYDNLPPSEIYRQKLRSVGRFSDEQINNKVESFLDKDDVDQELEVASFRDELKTKQYDRLSQLNKTQPLDEERSRKVAQKFDVDFEAECEKWEKKGEFFGVPYTPETSKRVKEAIETINVNGLLVNKDGTLNAKNAHFMFFSFLHAKDIVKAATGKAKQAEREKVAAIHQNAGRTTGVKTNKGGMDKLGTNESYNDAVERRIREAKERAQAQQRKPY
jgi:hypothetical protein